MREPAAKRLSTRLAAALAPLSPDEVAPLDRFRLGDRLMYSATTKLYAAAATDGKWRFTTAGRRRTGMARQFLEEQELDSAPE